MRLTTLIIILTLVPFSEIFTRGDSPVSLKVKGSYAYVKHEDVQASYWGAINARPPSRIRPQVKFSRSYAAPYARDGQCNHVKPAIPLLITACKASDGSIWAVQRWQRLARNYGGTTAVSEVHISHYTSVAQFVDLRWDAAFGANRLCGRYVYRGKGIYGFKSTSTGVPLDTYGRNIYLDTYDGQWRRENSFLAQAPDGRFCYLFVRGVGTKVRLTAIGPGVTPIVRNTVITERSKWWRSLTLDSKSLMTSTSGGMLSAY